MREVQYDRGFWLEEILRCPCGGRRVVLAMVFDPVAIERILRLLGLPFLRPAIMAQVARNVRTASTDSSASSDT